MLWANENSTTGMPTEPWKRSFRTVDFELILQNEVTFHVGETIIYPYIYISKEEARTCPCKLDVFECFKIISDAKNVHHPFSYGTLLVPTIRDMNIILFGRACTFFHMD